MHMGIPFALRYAYSSYAPVTVEVCHSSLGCIHVKLSNNLNILNKHQCQVIIKDPGKLMIQLGFEPRTFWLLVRHSYH